MRGSPAFLGAAAAASLILGACAAPKWAPGRAADARNLKAMREGTCSLPDSGTYRMLNADGVTSMAWYTRGALDSVYDVRADGMVESIERYRHGRRHGPQVAQDTLGRVYWTAHYVDDSLHGWWRLWHDNDTLAREVLYDRGREVPGTRAVFDTAGVRVLADPYKKDFLLGRHLLSQDSSRPSERREDGPYKAPDLDLSRAYRHFLRRNPRLRGTVRMEMLTNSAGRVVRSRPLTSTTKCHEFDLMIWAEHRDLHFNDPRLGCKRIRQNLDFDPR